MPTQSSICDCLFVEISPMPLSSSRIRDCRGWCC
ncbi:hypothetical protein RHECNPAF_2940018 [Rhizobium etli CNPAF512]|nr:hypothetical protein RHECNPAF_2940018 [Rhizobium etli CNPAF512]